MTPSFSLGDKNWRCFVVFTFNTIHFCGENILKLKKTLVDLVDNLIIYSECSVVLIRVVNVLCQIGLETSAMLVYCIKRIAILGDKVKQLGQLLFCRLLCQTIKSYKVLPIQS